MIVIDDLPPVPDETERLRDALRRIGRLTRWVGWMEIQKQTGAEDMREIQRIASEVTGWEFSEYT